MIQLKRVFSQKHFFLKFNKEVKQQISGGATGANFASPYACIYMDETKANFLKT